MWGKKMLYHYAGRNSTCKNVGFTQVDSMTTMAVFSIVSNLVVPTGKIYSSQYMYTHALKLGAVQDYLPDL